MATKPPKLSLEKWLIANFDPPPSMDTARRWVREGKIYPLPMKVGRAYYVEQDAEYVDEAYTRRRRLVDRILK